MTAAHYIEELTGLNKKHLGDGRDGFRGNAVHCVDKQGRQVFFTAPAEIAGRLEQLMETFAKEFQAAGDAASLSLCFARFYYGFIAIHPFPDANRRTAFSFLDVRAADKNYRLENLSLLQKVLLEGDVAGEMQKLMALFKEMLKS